MTIETLGYYFQKGNGRLVVAEINYNCPVCNCVVTGNLFNVIFNAWTPKEDIEAINRARFHNRKLPKRIENVIRHDLLAAEFGKSHRLKFIPDCQEGAWDDEAGEARCWDCCGVQDHNLASVNED